MANYALTPNGVKLVSVSSETLFFGGGAMALLGKEVAKSFADIDTSEFGFIEADEAFVAVHPALTDALRGINPSFMEAIVLHEEGHCLLGHCVPAEEYKEIVCPNGAVIFDSLAAELQADKHAADVVGSATLVAALTTSIDVILDLFKDRLGEEALVGLREGIYQSIQPRLDALVG
ncbi:MAG: hypothetical protein PHQ58_04340 [Rhodoferax sp.]|uniref:hypothetical protein n=1 Tax=Rhodoferax sp. TaxID=50421 RepID=UPI0026153C1F|nr:hypothetical protein [Rhodoferax sp.]MDD2879644.1 hypothetical protein [Rhodoferax sp.]